MKRINPFLVIYKQCNSKSNSEKYDEMQTEGATLPLYLDVELTNCCNIHCNMCPVGTGVMKRPKGFMSDEVFEKLVENIKKYKIRGVRFIRWGEPVLHPKFFDWGGVLKEEGVLVHFNTNGLLLNNEKIEKIFETEIDSIKFSFQGIDDLTYSEMRKDGSYSQLMNIIKATYEMRGEREKPYISVTTSITYESQKQIEEFKNKIRNYCDEIGIGQTKMEHIDIRRMRLSQARLEIYEKFINENQVEMKHVSVCPEIWNKLSINWDGSVSACCQDYDNMMIVGNILDNDLKEIFNGMQEKKYREILKDSDYDKLVLCRNCYEYMPLKK